MTLQRFRVLILAVICTLLVCQGNSLSLIAQDRTDFKHGLSVDSIFQDKLFKVEPFAGHWQSDGQGFELLRKDSKGDTSSVVRIGLSEDSAEEILIPSEWLKPDAEKEPLKIDAYEWSADRKKVLLFANTQRVWRLNTRGDYWVLNLADKSLKKIGGDVPNATLMFAKFSPDGNKIAYVYDHDIYLQDLITGNISRLTKTGTSTLVNGTFDWVYEEEFSIRDGFRFSPDGMRIAFWEIDSSGVELFPLIDNTSTLYPKIQYIPYPKVGTTNPAARIGLIDLQSRDISWAKIPGDNRNHYLPRMDWVGSNRLAVQQLNRQQNRLQLYLVDSVSGEASSIFSDEDAAWLDVSDDTKWLQDKSAFLWLSERSGWRHIYSVSSDGKSIRQVTSGEYDVIDILGIDEAKNFVYFYASPNDATQKYLYRVNLDGSDFKRLTPENQQGTYEYVLSPDYQRALVTFSRFAVAPQTQVVRLSDHSIERVVDTNLVLKDRLKDVRLPMHEFFALTSAKESNSMGGAYFRLTLIR